MRFLSKKRWVYTKKLQRLLSRIIKTLPRRAQIRLKDGILMTGRLDYPKAEISMVLDSEMQIWRLKACKNEPETVNWIEKYMKQGETFYDIGANVGAYSFVARAVGGKNSLVYAFEPSFSTCASLSENIILNNCQGEIIPLGIALSDKTGLTPLIYANTEAGSSMHSLADSAEAGSVFQLAISYRLDDLINTFKLRFPNHIKIDVDGVESEVVAGAGKILSDKNLRSMLIEIDEKLEAHRKIFDITRSAGFKIAEKHPKRSEKCFNYIFAR